MNSEVFNSSLGPNTFEHTKYTNEQARLILAGLFEQLLIFDKISITTNRLNSTLVFLIDRLGINIVEQLIDSGYIKIVLWTPFVFAGNGQMMENNTIDESSVYGQPPIIGGTLSGDDVNPEINIERALNHFNLPRDRKRIFTRRALKHYYVPNGMDFSNDSAELVIDAYKNNSLAELGLPFSKDADQLDVNARMELLGLSQKVLETAYLSKHNLKSYENYGHYQICKNNLDNIGKAYQVSDNTAVLFNLEGLPNLKELYLKERLDFESVFRLRHLSTAKYYRKWINTIGENSNAEEITKEYLNEIKGNKKFFESNEGKFVKNLTLFGANMALGAVVAGPNGVAAGYALGLLEDFWLDSILKGKNPSMFIDKIKQEGGN